MDIDKWPNGEWDNEPNLLHYIHSKTGHIILIKRNLMVGSLCGYVGVKETSLSYSIHDFLNKEKDEFKVHGSVTFFGYCQEFHEIIGVAYNEKKIVWLGFDCAHLYDIVPSLLLLKQDYINDCTYKNLSFVINQCAKLSHQLYKYLTVINN